MDSQALWVIAILGTGTIIGVLWRMKGGFSPFNVKALGLVFIAVLAALLAVARSDHSTAALSILSAIAGYLFGANLESGSTESNESRVDAAGANFGDNARVAGRDLNETVNNIHAQVEALNRLLSQETLKIDRFIMQQEVRRNGSMHYLVNTLTQRLFQDLQESMNIVVKNWESQGWKLVNITSDYQGTDGVILLFERPAAPDEAKVQLYRDLSMKKITHTVRDADEE